MEIFNTYKQSQLNKRTEADILYLKTYTIIPDAELAGTTYSDEDRKKYRRYNNWKTYQNEKDAFEKAARTRKEEEGSTTPSHSIAIIKRRRSIKSLFELVINACSLLLMILSIFIAFCFVVKHAKSILLEDGAELSHKQAEVYKYEQLMNRNAARHQEVLNRNLQRTELYNNAILAYNNHIRDSTEDYSKTRQTIYHAQDICKNKSESELRFEDHLNYKFFDEWMDLLNLYQRIGQREKIVERYSNWNSIYHTMIACKGARENDTITCSDMTNSSNWCIGNETKCTPNEYYETFKVIDEQKGQGKEFLMNREIAWTKCKDIYVADLEKARTSFEETVKAFTKPDREPDETFFPDVHNFQEYTPKKTSVLGGMFIPLVSLFSSGGAVWGFIQMYGMAAFQNPGSMQAGHVMQVVGTLCTILRKGGVKCLIFLMCVLTFIILQWEHVAVWSASKQLPVNYQVVRTDLPN